MKINYYHFPSTTKKVAIIDPFAKATVENHGSGLSLFQMIAKEL